jgi:hypothetical protein
MLMAQGVAGAIEACASRDPEVARIQTVTMGQLKYPLLLLFLSGAVIAVVGAFVRSGDLPVIPTAILLNLLAVLAPIRMTYVLVRYVQSIRVQLGHVPEILHERYLGIGMTMASIWNWTGVFVCAFLLVGINAPLVNSAANLRVSPYLLLFFMPICYFGPGYFFYMAYLIATTRRSAAAIRRALGDGVGL